MSNIQEYKSKYKLRDIAILLSIFAILYVSSSYNIVLIKGGVSLLISATFAVFLIIVQPGVKVNRKLLLIVLLLCINVVVSSLLMGDTFKDLVIMVAVITISFIIVTAIDVEEYFDKYNKIIYMISLYSLVTYFIAVFFPNIIRFFPSAYYRPGNETYNLGLSFVNLNNRLIRNMGIFWEPGAFQTYLVLAILGEIFIIKNSNIKRLWLLFLTLITTWSTTGLIVGVMLIVIYLVHKNIYKRSKFIKIFFVLILFFLLLSIIYSILPNEMQYAFFGKITTFMNSDKSTLTSAHVRMTSITYPFKAFLKSPILGSGYFGLNNSVLSAGHTMATSTPINWFAAYGIIFGIICFSGVYGLSYKMSKKSKLIR